MKLEEVPAFAGQLARPVYPILLPTPYPVGPVWVYLLPGDPLTLVDTGPATGAAWRALKAGLAAYGLAPQDVRRVLVTHGHHDHMGLARKLQAFGAEVLAHPADRNNLGLRRHFANLNRVLYRLGVSFPNRMLMMVGLWALDRTSKPLKRFSPLAVGQEIPSQYGPLRVHHVPGHSPGHVAFELPEEGVWLSGDVLLSGIVPNAVLEPDPQNPSHPFPALSVYRSTLQKLASSPPRALLPAHGPAILEVAALARETLAKQEQRSQTILRHLSAQPQTLATILTAMYPKARGLSLFLAYSDLYGHLLELERQGLVVRASRNGVETFYTP
ncbi:MAG: hydrolase [Thermoanaerobaculum sp.]|nr:MAG: hydrolase [Thermoanaerobaculum sp.]